MGLEFGFYFWPSTFEYIMNLTWLDALYRQMYCSSRYKEICIIQKWKMEKKNYFINRPTPYCRLGSTHQCHRHKMNNKKELLITTIDSNEWHNHKDTDRPNCIYRHIQILQLLYTIKAIGSQPFLDQGPLEVSKVFLIDCR